MEHISDAVITMGFISFALQFTYHIHYVESPSDTKEQIKSKLGALASSIIRLSDLLHTLETQPRNPMVPLPAGLKAAIRGCTSHLNRLEALLRSRSQQVETGQYVMSMMELRNEDVENVRGTLQIQIDKLMPYTPPNYLPIDPEIHEDATPASEEMRPWAKPESMQTYDYRLNSTTVTGFQNIGSHSNEKEEDTSVLNKDLEFTDQTHEVVRRLFQEEMTYSRRQLHEILRVLKEIYDLGALTSTKNMLGGQWRQEISSSLRRHSGLAERKPTTGPSVAAHEAIMALKLLATMIRRSTGDTALNRFGMQERDTTVGTIEKTGRLTVRFTVGPADLRSIIRPLPQESKTPSTVVHTTKMTRNLAAKSTPCVIRQRVRGPYTWKNTARKSTGGLVPRLYLAARKEANQATRL